MEAAAAKAGVGRLSEWVAGRVRTSLKPAEASPIVESLKEQVQRLQGDLDYERRGRGEAEAARKEWEQRYLQALDRVQALTNSALKAKEKSR